MTHPANSVPPDITGSAETTKDKEAGAQGVLAVSEIFSTIQGEGPTSGKTCTFLRLGGCNLACNWCDTPYTWKWDEYDPKQELTKMTPEQVVSRLEKENTKHLVISGGEPMLQWKQLQPILRTLRMFGWTFEMETAGTISPPVERNPPDIRFNISPKLENSGNPKDKRYKPEVIDDLLCYGGSILKFVVKDVSDFVEIDEIVNDIGVPPNWVWIMPEGRTKEELLRDEVRDIVEEVKKRRWNFSQRLHVLIWDQKRAV